MARQNIAVDPSKKLFEAYMDFSGGLNSETSNERLMDNECPVLENVDLSGRGSAKRRTGRKSLGTVAGKPQGMFYFYRKNQTKPDIILASSGKLYLQELGEGEIKPLEIKNGEEVFTFQESRPIKAVQFGTTMYVATGTKLLQIKYLDDVDPKKWETKVAEPYKPTPMEALYIGLNALADNPDTYVLDGEGPMDVTGIIPSYRTGVVNQTTTFRVFVNKPAATVLEYEIEYNNKAEGTGWLKAQTWAAGNEATIKFKEVGEYDIRANIRKAGTTTPEESFTLPKFKVNQVEDKEANKPKPYDGIHTCTNIILHWDRLLMSGDTVNPTQLYISDLNAPTYFPSTNTIAFETGKREAITAMVRFKDTLAVFTKTTVQCLNGKSPDDYTKMLIHDGIGCVAGDTAQVAGNDIFFLSDDGIYMLRPNPFTLETLNVKRIDAAIKSEVPYTTKATSIVYDSQYWIAFPETKTIYRFYYETGVWVKDRSEKLNLLFMDSYGDDVHEFTTDGNLYVQDSDTWTDVDETYEMRVEMKYLDLTASFNFKKLKRIYVLAKHYLDYDVGVKTYVHADSALALTPETGTAKVVDGRVEWVVETDPNMEFEAGSVLGLWNLGHSLLGSVVTSVKKATIRGKCRRVKVTFVHSQNTPCEIFGFGLEFKAKKP